MIHFKLTELAKRHSMSIEDCVGDIRYFAAEQNDKPLREQLDEMYQHGGGWRPLKGFQLKSEKTFQIEYPEDPPMNPLAIAKFRDQLICVYEYAFVAIFEPDFSFEVARMD